MFRYKAGMTSRDLTKIKSGNRYANAPHIGRIIPAKRHANTLDVSQQKLTNSDKIILKEKENQLKDYTAEGSEYMKMTDSDFKLEIGRAHV